MGRRNKCLNVRAKPLASGPIIEGNDTISERQTVSGRDFRPVPGGHGHPSMLQEPKFLSATQFLLTTLVVKLAAMAALATMLARYRRFRHILIFEQRNWPDRLVFALGLAVPFTTGVAARILLNYDAADLTLEGAFLAGLIAGPYTGAIVGLSIALPALAAGEYGAPFFAVGCGFAGGGIREACPKEDIWEFSPFVIFSLPRYVWRMLRDMHVNWQV